MNIFIHRKSLILFGVTAACAAPTASFAQSFQTFYSKTYIPKMEKAIETSDLKFFESVYASDFTEKTAHGTNDRAKELAEMKQQFVGLKDTKCKVKMVSSKVNGAKATAVAKMKLDTSTKMPDGKYHTISIEVSETESWVKTGAGWKMKSAVDGSQKILAIDGKAPPAGMGG